MDEEFLIASSKWDHIKMDDDETSNEDKIDYVWIINQTSDTEF